MKLYETLDVNINYQNFGSTWLGILRGPTEQIELAYNGLFNYCATNGEHEFKDHLRTVTTFWSSRRAMRRYFFNCYYQSRQYPNMQRKHGKLIRKAMRYAWAKLGELQSTSHEFFMNFDTGESVDAFTTGRICAERPDEDFKDSVISAAFKDKTVDKESIIE